MKKHLLTIAFVFAVLLSYAQVPQQINYQAAARYASGDVMAAQQLGVQVKIRQTSATGTVVYSETFSPTTNQYGIFTLPVGAGAIVSGTFSGINWSTGNYFIEVMIDSTGGTSYTSLGTSQLLSVPYALYAGNGGGGATGPTGATGSNGVTGAQGPTGVGATGPTGVGGSGSGWLLTGNGGTNSSTNFIGTTDPQKLIFKVNNIQSGKIDFQSPYNTSLGFQAIPATAFGVRNTAMGYNALMNVMSGSKNTAFGFAALSSSDGYSNTAVGDSAMSKNTSGYGNTGIGSRSLEENTTGSNNTAIGLFALFSNGAGEFNTGIGSQSLEFAVGSYNTAIGYNVFQYGNYSNSTALGYNTQILASNNVRIGNTAITSIGGQVGWTTVSDARLKQNIQPSQLGLDFILKLNPVTYNYKAEGQKGILYTGFIAQDVEKAAKEIGTTFSGVDAPKNENDFYGLRYGEFVVPLVKAVQELSNENADLKTRVERLEYLLLQQAEVKK